MNQLLTGNANPFTLHQGDCSTVLQQYPDNHFSVVVTDPPYFFPGGFMNKSWDRIGNFEKEILCKSTEFVQYVTDIFLSTVVVLNMDVDALVQEGVNTSPTQSHLQPISAITVDKYSQDTGQNQNSNSVHGIAITKAEVRALLSVISANHISAIEKLPDNVLFVVPISFIISQLKSTADENVLKSLTNRIWSVPTIQVSLMDEARISGAIAALTGIKPDNLFIKETTGPVNVVAPNAQTVKYSVITLSPTERQSAMTSIISLLCAAFATQRLRGNQESFLIYQWHKNWLSHAFRVLKPGGHLVAFASTKTFHQLFQAVEDAGFELRDMLAWMYGQGFPKSANNHDLGLGSTLKPAFEPICLARKPLDGTLEENRQKWGTGYLNIDACRIPTNPNVDDKRLGVERERGHSDKMAKNVYEGGYRGDRVGSSNLGRWPANLLHDGSDEVLSVFPDSDGQNGRVGPEHGDRPTINTYGEWGPRPCSEPRGDSGSAARFFYCAKASRADRNEGCENLPPRAMNWSSGDESHGTFQSENTNRSSPNYWPTVKPTDLMRYLIRLVTPKDGLVLDPFMGSGSTLKAAIYEFNNCVGIDREPDALTISQARCLHALRMRGPMSLF